MTDFLQLTIAGISQGSLYAMLAIGLIVIYSVGHVVNVAQGDFAMLAGFITIGMLASGLPLLPSILVAVLSVTLLSVLIERVIISRAKGMTTLVSIMLTLGISTLLQAVMLIVWGPGSQGLQPFPGSSVVIGGVSIRSQDFWVIGTMIVMAVGILLFQEYARWGKGLHATADQPVAARIVGISPWIASAIAFGIAGFVGAIAGVVSSPITLTTWSAGLLLGLKGFVGAVLGGLVSIRAAVVGSLILGMLEAYVAAYVSSGLRDAVAFLILILVLMVRPTGLVLRKEAVRV